MITYSDRKDLPSEGLLAIFRAVGWSDGSETEKMIRHFNAPFLHSTAVFSAWEGEVLIGCVRVLSDRSFRSFVYDLAVLPEYQGQGIGRNLIQLCMNEFPDSQWILETIPERVGFYEKMGFTEDHALWMRKTGKWF